MTEIKPIRLRKDEINDYIEDNKMQLVVDEESAISESEKAVVVRCGVDYGLTIDESLTPQQGKKSQDTYNIILRIKGGYTMPEKSRFRSENGMVTIIPLIIHDGLSIKRFHKVAKELCKNAWVSSPVAIDDEYMYEALRETSFNMEMEEVTRLGPGFQLWQVEFDENGHFTVFELDESITS